MNICHAQQNIPDDDAQLYGLIANIAFIHFDIERMMPHPRTPARSGAGIARTRTSANLIADKLQTTLEDSSHGLEVERSSMAFISCE